MFSFVLMNGFSPGDLLIWIQNSISQVGSSLCTGCWGTLLIGALPILTRFLILSLNVHFSFCSYLLVYRVL